MKIVIVIPTYNEAKNIGRLIDVVGEEFKKMPQHSFSVLVIDDSSPDGTAKIVEEKSKQLSFVHLLVRKEKNGLGVAYTHGFKYAMQELGADVLIEMDGDFQHDPKDIVRLVAEIDNGYDYVIGSRFCKGGGIPRQWELKRRLFSKLGNLVSKIILGVKGVNDFTTGYKASRVKGFVDTIDLNNILSKGFAYKMDLLYKMHKAGAKIKEIPIQFGLRDEGSSKMEKNNLLDSLKVVLLLRLKDKDTQKFLKFCAVGFVGLITDAGLANIFRITILSSKNAPLLSGFIAMMVTFLLNNFWSFNEFKIKGIGSKFLYFIVYCVSSCVPIVFRAYFVGFCVNKFGNSFIVFNIAFFIGIVVGLVWNFLVYSKIIWRKK
ncbi:glycosyltransferase family 2 protein [Patescibacteria group bacterium]|nr:glycosyltransferase family 2 protein [Patescibacteria group bacterium]MBU1953052.1 glycosyltransferase family 2 protein [Patescibacteria group bacterium]